MSTIKAIIMTIVSLFVACGIFAALGWKDAPVALIVITWLLVAVAMAALDSHHNNRKNRP